MLVSAIISSLVPLVYPYRQRRSFLVVWKWILIPIAMNTPRARMPIWTCRRRSCATTTATATRPPSSLSGGGARVRGAWQRGIQPPLLHRADSQSDLARQVQLRTRRNETEGHRWSYAMSLQVSRSREAALRWSGLQEKGEAEHDRGHSRNAVRRANGARLPRFPRSMAFRPDINHAHFPEWPIASLTSHTQINPTPHLTRTATRTISWITKGRCHVVDLSIRYRAPCGCVLPGKHGAKLYKSHGAVTISASPNPRT